MQAPGGMAGPPLQHTRASATLHTRSNHTQPQHVVFLLVVMLVYSDAATYVGRQLAFATRSSDSRRIQHTDAGRAAAPRAPHWQVLAHTGWRPMPSKTQCPKTAHQQPHRFTRPHGQLSICRAAGLVGGDDVAGLPALALLPSPLLLVRWNR